MDRLLVAACLAGLSLACEAPDSGESGEPEPGLSETECEGVVGFLCTAACVCECELTGPGMMQSYPDEQTCREVLEASCDGSLGTKEDGSACNGDVVKEVSMYQCGEPVEFPASCDVFFDE